jgi:hypothetical protein
LLCHVPELFRQGGADEFGLRHLPRLSRRTDGVRETSRRAGANDLDVSSGVGVGYLSVLAHGRSVLQTAPMCYKEAADVTEFADFAAIANRRDFDGIFATLGDILRAAMRHFQTFAEGSYNEQL